MITTAEPPTTALIWKTSRLTGRAIAQTDLGDWVIRETAEGFVPVWTPFLLDSDIREFAPLQTLIEAQRFAELRTGYEIDLAEYKPALPF